MGKINVPVSPLSGYDIEKTTSRYLSRVMPKHLCKPGALDVEALLEVHINRTHGFKVCLCNSSEIDGDEARVDPFERIILMSHAVHNGICCGDPRSRFTACHEAAHVLMHVPQIISWNDQDYAKAILMARGGARLPIYMNAEWQAEYGGGCLLMPMDTIGGFVAELRKTGAPDDYITKRIMEAYGVSQAAARKRLSIIKNRNPMTGGS